MYYRFFTQFRIIAGEQAELREKETEGGGRGGLGKRRQPPWTWATVVLVGDGG